jgi:hypothetical protein
MVRDERRQQVVAGLGVLAAVAALIVAIAYARYLPGLAGEFFARVLGIVTTPFLLETSFFILGLVLVMSLNLWRQRRDGDEFVYLEEVKDAPAGLPDQARWALYAGPPLDSVPPTKADLLEGAVAIGDHAQAVAILAAMDDAERARPEVMRQRIELARATGKDELALRLERELAGDGA